MATRTTLISQTPLDITTGLSLVNGQDYLLQNVANRGQVFLAEHPNTATAPVAGSAAMELNVNDIIGITQTNGHTFYAWTGLTASRVTITEAD